MFSEVSTTDLVTQIARQITEAIVTGHLKPGERLTELQLSREFGTSRAPVREAARLLESQGLVTFSPRRGFFVRTFSASEMRDIYELRIGLELHAGYLAVERATETDIAALENQLSRLYGTAGQASIETQIFEDFAFHRMLCSASGNARLIRVYDELATEMRAGITLIGKIYDDPQRMAETHEPIMDALRKRNGDELREALRYHIAVARDAVVALFEELEKGA